ncbi:hypothetical protein ASG29_06475 [Sphingomonas sp. Leaf412]|uniref:ATP-binding protein n=1 Tax=Sphingomonas sp. Leaf412 TaxID=1736370 RepID=UPI0006F8E9CC|nr:ATP-binding protein [Sphingomonas sp. Leaf412]KQT33652.1 hypothetical protein ASG29_06475 [Sphingomonas sp. Leaf412]
MVEARPPRSEDRLLLDESVHRTANEITAAIAALRLVKAARGPDARLRMVDEALLRLEGFAGTHRLLAHLPVTSVNAGADLEQLCRKIVEGRRLGGRKTVTLSIPDLWLDGATARRLLLIAAELVANALHHSLAVGGSRLEVALTVEGTDAVMTVADDGPGIAPSAATGGTGQGTGIVDDLVHLSEGTIERRTGVAGTTVTVTLPLDMTALARVRGRG